MNTITTDNAIAKELQRAKTIIDQFILSCSHNLKSPLTSIEGLVMIAEHCSTNEEINQCLGMIQNCATSMQAMIYQLEEYTENLRRELLDEEIKPEMLLERILDEYDGEIGKEGIAVSTVISQSMKWFGDEHINYLILKNLIANAIQFSDPNKELKKVNLKLGVKRNHVQVEVSDNGIGISEEEKEKIFEPFHRSSSQSKGNGLGLFLVKGLVDKIKASISIISTEQVGTSILFSTPNR